MVNQTEVGITYASLFYQIKALRASETLEARFVILIALMNEWGNLCVRLKEEGPASSMVCEASVQTHISNWLLNAIDLDELHAFVLAAEDKYKLVAGQTHHLVQIDTRDADRNTAKLNDSTKKHLKAAIAQVKKFWNKKNFTSLDTHTAIKYDRTAAKALNTYETPTQTFWKWIGYLAGFGYATGCGLTVFASYILASHASFLVVSAASFFALFTFKVNLTNISLNYVPECLIEMFGRDKWFQGLAEFYNEQGHRSELSILQKVLLAVGIIGAVMVGSLFGAIAWQYISSLATMDYFSTVGSIFMPLGISLGVLSAITEFVMMMVGIAEFMQTDNSILSALYHYFNKLIEDQPLIRQIMTVGLIILLGTLCTVGLCITMNATRIALAELFSHFGMSFYPQITSMVFMVVADILQLPLLLMVSSKLAVNIANFLFPPEPLFAAPTVQTNPSMKALMQNIHATVNNEVEEVSILHHVICPGINGINNGVIVADKGGWAFLSVLTSWAFGFSNLPQGAGDKEQATEDAMNYRVSELTGISHAA